MINPFASGPIGNANIKFYDADLQKNHQRDCINRASFLHWIKSLLQKIPQWFSAAFRITSEYVILHMLALDSLYTLHTCCLPLSLRYLILLEKKPFKTCYSLKSSKAAIALSTYPLFAFWLEAYLSSFVELYKCISTHRVSWGILYSQGHLPWCLFHLLQAPLSRRLGNSTLNTVSWYLAWTSYGR